MQWLFRFSLIALLMVGATIQARADFMDWSYHWSISPAAVLSSGTGSVALALSQDGNGASSISTATVTASRSATNTPPENYKAGQNMTPQLTDKQSHQS